MKKNVLVVLFAALLLTFTVLPLHAEKVFPVQEISGVIKDVITTLPESDWSGSAGGYTTIEFKDGRLVTFNGIYIGLVFEKGKECKISYQRSNAAFVHGIFIKKIEYAK